MKSKLIALLIAVMAALTLTGCGTIQAPDITDVLNPAVRETPTSTDSQVETAHLIRVVDGDTIVIDRGYGEEKVRMIGIDTPESVHPDESRNTEAGDAASAYTKELLSGVDTVYLQKDVSDTDKYGRLLRYVWLDDPATADAEASMVNALLVAAGTAEPADFPPDTTYSELFHSLAE